MTTINPFIIDTIINAVSDFRVIDSVPMDHFVLVKLATCPCHGATAGMVEHKAISEAPKGLHALRQDRTETSLPVVIMDESGTVVHVRTIRWDEPRPFVASAGMLVFDKSDEDDSEPGLPGWNHMERFPKCNSRGGSA